VLFPQAPSGGDGVLSGRRGAGAARAAIAGKGASERLRTRCARLGAAGSDDARGARLPALARRNDDSKVRARALCRCSSLFGLQLG
jgi:hypothetical protein